MQFASSCGFNLDMTCCILNYLLQETVNGISKFREEVSRGSLPNPQLSADRRESIINILGSQKALSIKRTCTDLPPKNLSPIPYSTGCILFYFILHRNWICGYLLLYVFEAWYLQLQKKKQWKKTVLCKSIIWCRNMSLDAI